jgi:hypothetical protein
MEVLANSEDFVAPRMARVMVTELVLPFVDGRLKLQRKLGFVSLDQQVGQDTAKESGGLLAGHGPDELIAVDWVSRAVAIDAQPASVGSLQGLDHRQVGHAYPHERLVTDVIASGLCPLRDADVALAVEKTGGVSVIECDDQSLSLGWDAGEFGGSPMPGPQGRGRVTPSQAGSRDWLPGVCNEQGPAAKAKACSELHGNVERSAEMTGPASCKHRTTDYMSQVTDCNTDYLFWRPHRDRNMVPLERRGSLNQDATVQLIVFMGNMTASNRELQGVIFQT